jgi:hypothetical protein
MTSKDYIRFAAAFRNVNPRVNGLDKITNANIRQEAWRACRDAISLVLQDDNPRFDAERFNAACDK